MRYALLGQRIWSPGGYDRPINLCRKAGIFSRQESMIRAASRNFAGVDAERF